MCNTAPPPPRERELAKTRPHVGDEGVAMVLHRRRRAQRRRHRRGPLGPPAWRRGRRLGAPTAAAAAPGVAAASASFRRGGRGALHVAGNVVVRLRRGVNGHRR